MMNLRIANEELEAATSQRRNEINQAVRSALRATMQAAKTNSSGLAAAMGIHASMVDYVIRGDRQVSANFLARFCAAVDADPAKILAQTWEPGA